MCGLLASVGFIADHKHLQRVAHRGPDHEGWRQEKRPDGTDVLLAHRRLSIIDPSARAHQPFVSKNGRYTLIFNGVIYNYQELQQILSAKGHVFETSSDTEVLLVAFAHWGARCLKHIHGMFVFIVFDNQTGELFAARDPFGIKPLYFSRQGNKLVLGSEIKQLVDVWSNKPRLNHSAVLDFLLAGVTDHEAETLFRGIFQLLPGHILRFGLDNQLNIDQFTDPSLPSLQANMTNQNTDQVEEFQHHLQRAMDQHMRHDVTLGFMLSGGLDSSSLISLAKSDEKIAPLHGFTASFPGTPVDETGFAKQVANNLQAHHTLISPSIHDILSKIDEVLYHQDLPFPSTSIFSQWFVFESAHQADTKVMICGQGADELMFGYHNAFAQRLRQLLRDGRWLAATGLLRDRAKKHGLQTMLTDCKDNFGPWVRRIIPANIRARLRGRHPNAHVPNWLNPSLSPGAKPWTNPLQKFLATQQSAIKSDALNEKTWRAYQIRTGSMPMLLRYEDRNSMAHGIEARVPYLDDTFSSFALGLSAEHFYDKAQTKDILRRAMKDILPETVRLRQDKLGFATPEEQWFAGEMKPWLIKNATEAGAGWPQIFQAEGISKLVEMADDPEVLRSLWRIAIFGRWLEIFGFAKKA